jgi:hypothetical protein
MASGKTDRSSGDGDTLRDVVTLDDLAPRHDVRGGSGRRVFGADTKAFASEGGMTGKKVKKTKDLAPKGTSKVKGGRLATNENLTLVRATSPNAKKHL